MEHVSTLSLVVITFLQLCQAELPGSWYAANVINDGDFSPKPISEIFTTEATNTFSPTNPIVVLPSSTTSPSGISTSIPTVISSSISTAAFTSEEFVSTTPSPQTISSFATTQPTQGSFDQQQPFQSSFKVPLQQAGASQQVIPPNYFLIYQQVPQSVQPLPPSAPQEFLMPFQSTPSSNFPAEVSNFPSTFSTFPSTQQSLSTFPPNPSSIFQPEVSTPQPTLSTFRPSTASTLSPTLSTLQPSVSTVFSTDTTQPARSTRTVVPCNNPTGRPLTRASVNPGDPVRYPTLRIRMVAPSGSITNVNINPTASTTTRRTTTTRRPTTTRTRRTRRNRNSFDGCINACNGRSPICATPLAVTPIDPNALKGFPSICHMACHNSFKRNQYEMLVDGRCGRLRTRIQTVDSNTKLKRVELNKSQYTIVDNPQTIVEFSSLPR